MSRSQLNYVNDNTIGKRSVMGGIAMRGKEYELIKNLDFETVTLGTYAALGAPDGTEDLIGQGDNAQYVYYLSTIISDNNIYLYTATDENGTGMANLDTITISPFVSSTGKTDSIDVNSGKLILTNAGVIAVSGLYLFASYKYVIAKGDFEIERRIVDDSIYVFQSGVTAKMSHAVGNPGTETDGNFRHDRKGTYADGSARRLGDIFVVKDKIKGSAFVAFGANLDVFDTNYWQPVIPIAMSEDENSKYTKDASLEEGDVKVMLVTAVVGQIVTVTQTVPATSASDFKGVTVSGNKQAVNIMILSCPDLELTLPIDDNTGTAVTFDITIKTGFTVPVSLVGKYVYVRRKKASSFERKNTVLRY